MNMLTRSPEWILNPIRYTGIQAYICAENMCLLHGKYIDKEYFFHPKNWTSTKLLETNSLRGEKPGYCS